VTDYMRHISGGHPIAYGFGESMGDKTNADWEESTSPSLTLDNAFMIIRVSKPNVFYYAHKKDVDDCTCTILFFRSSTTFPSETNSCSVHVRIYSPPKTMPTTSASMGKG